jgi:hypothetical protein
MSENLKFKKELIDLVSIMDSLIKEIKKSKFFKCNDEKEKKKLEKFLQKFSELLECQRIFFLMYSDTNEKFTEEMKDEMIDFLDFRLKMNNIFIDKIIKGEI